MSEKHEKVYTSLNYFVRFLIFTFAINGCVSISAFASLIRVPVGIANSSVWRKICEITAGIKKYKSIIKKKKKKHDKIVLLAKLILDTIEVLIFMSLIDSCISHYEFFSVNKVLREYNEMKEEIILKNPENLKLLWNTLYIYICIYIYICKLIIYNIYMIDASRKTYKK